VQNPAAFTRLAEQYSECPTAFNGGLLGRVKPGQLYAQLDAALFALPASGISAVLESELGFHLLYCEQIHPPTVRTLNEVCETLRTHLQQQRIQQQQKAWLRSLS